MEAATDGWMKFASLLHRNGTGGEGLEIQLAACESIPITQHILAAEICFCHRKFSRGPRSAASNRQTDLQVSRIADSRPHGSRSITLGPTTPFLSS